MASRKKASMASVDFASRPGGLAPFGEDASSSGYNQRLQAQSEEIRGKRRDERGDMAQCATPGLTRALAARVAPAV
jgi:hypothetical protein